MRECVVQIVKTMRVKHWLKNGLVFLPLLFSGSLTSLQDDVHGVISFFGFSLMASAVYIMNDIKDKEADAAHPQKSMRPIASGAVGVPMAVVLSAFLAFASLCISAIWAVDAVAATETMLLYALLNVFYSFKAKDIAVVDVTILSIGFLLRVLYGGFYCGIVVSAWLCLCILALSFFFSLGKRRGELLRHGADMRPSLRACTVGFFDKSMYAFMSMGLVFYSLWLSDRLKGMEGTSSAIILSISVIVAIIPCLRYSALIESGSSDGDPVEVVLSDKTLVAFVVLWVAVMVLLLYALI